MIALCRSENLEEALRCFEKDPDSSGAATLISRIVKPRELKFDSTTPDQLNQCFKIFDTLCAFARASSSPSRVRGSSIRALTLACHSLAQPGRVLPLLDVIEEFKVPIDHISFANLARGCAATGETTIARRLVQLVTEHRIPFIPNVMDCTQLIQAFLRDGVTTKTNTRLEEALGVLRIFDAIGVRPNAHTMACLMKGCADAGKGQHGRQLHMRILRERIPIRTVLAAAIVTMYSKCGSLQEARAVFSQSKSTQPSRGHRPNELSEDHVHLWTAMITALIEHGHADEALDVYREMVNQREIQPDEVAFLSALTACGLADDLEQGRDIHRQLTRMKQADNGLAAAIVTMYSRCGSLTEARKAFEESVTANNGDTMLWTSMITSYGHHGHGKEALDLYHRMENAGVLVNDVTLVGVLNACSHAGLVEEGQEVFASMSNRHAIRRDIRHFNCLIDLLGRAGQLAKAEEVISQLPIGIVADSATWMTLLGASRIVGDINCAERAARALIQLTPDAAGLYVTLANIYAAQHKWADQERVLADMKDRKITKIPGISRVRVNGQLCEFIAGDKSHPHIEKIHQKLHTLLEQIKQAGYRPSLHWVLHDISDEEKEDKLCTHSEKLAIAWALIASPPDSVIRVTKNLRVCGDCHTATAFISLVTKREIVVRDANRFHHSKDGKCSCNNYW